MNKHYGKMEKYRSSEGRVIKIKYNVFGSDKIDTLGKSGKQAAVTAAERCIGYYQLFLLISRNFC